MEGRDEALIDRYLAQEASPDEIREVEERRRNDASFRQKLNDSELALQALRLHQREELRKRFRKRDETLDKSTGEDPPRSRIAPWLLIIGFIGLGILIWMLIPGSTSSVSPAPTHLPDSLSTSEQKQTPVDTSVRPGQKSEQKQPVEEDEQKESKPIAQSTQQGDKLFAAYFSPHVDDMMDPAVRGDGELTPLEKFQLAYWEKRYADALKEFPAITETMKQNDNVRFMQANALMATGRINQAQIILESVLVNQKSRYLTEVYWNLALCELKRGKLDDAQKHLELYVQGENAFKKAEAVQILKEIR